MPSNSVMYQHRSSPAVRASLPHAHLIRLPKRQLLDLLPGPDSSNSNDSDSDSSDDEKEEEIVLSNPPIQPTTLTQVQTIAPTSISTPVQITRTVTTFVPPSSSSPPVVSSQPLTLSAESSSLSLVLTSVISDTTLSSVSSSPTSSVVVTSSQIGNTPESTLPPLTTEVPPTPSANAINPSTTSTSNPNAVANDSSPTSSSNPVAVGSVSNNGNGTALPTGAIIAIVVCVVLVVLAAILCVMRRLYKRSRERRRGEILWPSEKFTGLGGGVDGGSPELGMSQMPGVTPFTLTEPTAPQRSLGPSSVPYPFAPSPVPYASRSSPAPYVSHSSPLPPQPPSLPASLPPPQPRGIGPSIYVVRSTFVPTMPDELSISAGEKIRVLSSYDDGWALCQSLGATKEKGMVPLECLDRAPVPPQEGEGRRESSLRGVRY